MPIHTFTQQAARFANVHGITGCAGDGVHNFGGVASELSLWAGKRDNLSLSTSVIDGECKITEVRTNRVSLIYLKRNLLC